LITLDTSAVYAMMTSTDPRHIDVQRVLSNDSGPYFVPTGPLGELCYLVERRLPAEALIALLDDLDSGGYTRDHGEHDLPRIRQLVQRYADFPLGFVDAAVVACAERHGGRVLTTDFRHFGAVAREGTISLPLMG
jgi:predicted nucleic acid-binding protein